MKAALKAQQDPNHWAEALPLILLGIRTAFKDDLQCTAAELVYGTSLRLPGEFFTPSSDDNLDPTTYVSRLRSTMQTLQATPTRHTQRSQVHISNALTSASHVFIWNDTVRKPLQPPYNGPVKVLSRAEKYYTIDINGRHDKVSIDRLKPAHLLEDTQPVATPPDTSDTPTQPSPPPSPPTRTLSRASTPPRATPAQTAPPVRSTRSGRRVHWPARLAEFVP